MKLDLTKLGSLLVASCIVCKKARHKNPANTFLDYVDSDDDETNFLRDYFWLATARGWGDKKNNLDNLIKKWEL